MEIHVSARQLRSRPLDVLGGLFQKPDGVCFSWDGCPVWLFRDPNSVESILLHQQKSFVRSGGPKRLAHLLGNGLLRSHGSEHLRQKRLVASAFTPREISRHSFNMGEIADRYFATWKSGDVRDIHHEMVQLTLGLVGRIFFGLSEGASLTRFGDALQTAISSLAPGTNRLSDFFRSQRFDDNLKIVNSWLYELIETRRQHPTSDLLSVLIRAKDVDGDDSHFSLAELRDQLVTLLVAGHETTASAITWAIELLAHHPECQERLAEELLGSDGREYARAVFSESLRLYPPAWILFRRAIEEVRVGAIAIPKGGHAALSPFHSGRDPYFFENPVEFRPERWMNGREAHIPRGVFFPFGLGNRRCLGEAFAWAEGTEILSSIARHFKWSPLSRRQTKPAPLFTLRPSRKTWIRVRYR